MGTRSSMSPWWLLLLLVVPHSGGTTKRKTRLSLAELRGLALAAGFGENAEQAAAIAMRESGGDPNVVNDTRGRTDLPKGTTNEYSVGLWQVNVLSSPQYKPDWLKEPRNNARAAHDLFLRAGWTPWRLPNT